ncbi:MAG TPA: hypothetical protein VMN03_15710 [Burkholderiales bacterium]|nr:hypothetical protein [Burkholderiales bacterium]
MLSLALLVAGCVQPLPYTPADIQAKRFEALPDKAVIYVVRDDPDFTNEPSTITLDDSGMITTYPGTYYRWEAEPGVRRIEGYVGDLGRIALPVEAGRIYFVLQRVSYFMRFPQSHFNLVAEPHGRAVVGRSELVGGR